jgi:hypothetical protein
MTVQSPGLVDNHSPGGRKTIPGIHREMRHGVELCLDPVTMIAFPIPVSTMEIMVTTMVIVVVSTVVFVPVPVAGLSRETAKNKNAK